MLPLRALLAVTAAGALTAGCSDTVQVDAPEPSGADAAACRALLARLPDTVADQTARTVDPADAPAAAWGDPPIVLQCGGPAPAGFGRTSACTSVNGVDWFIPENELDTEGGDVTMTTVKRRPYVQVQLPAEYWPPATAMADLARAVRQHTTRTGRCH